MGRNYIIAQETMVNADGQELGLSYGPIRIIPSFKHMDIKADDFQEIELGGVAGPGEVLAGESDETAGKSPVDAVVVGENRGIE